MTPAVSLTGVLGDFAYLIITIMFFALAALLVRACEHISGGEAPTTPLDRDAEGRS
jgi:hypothetical protein